jgi:hypothetical protein
MDGTKRLVIDYSGLKAATALTLWPLPTLEEVLDSVSAQNVVYWSSLDLRNGYRQTELDPETADHSEAPADGTRVSSGVAPNPPVATPDEWHEIEAVLKRRKCASKDMFFGSVEGDK